jgi:hypothetical protein
MTATWCDIGADGRLRGPADITWNAAWPTPDGETGFAEPADGMVFHTEVGYEHNVIDEFNNIAAQASSFFSIGDDGHIHQYGPVGSGWVAWTQSNGNYHYRGVEHEDNGNPAIPLTAAQLAASAMVFEALSHHDGFPLAATDKPVGGKGLIFHSDGGVPWGNHDCPGAVRRAQRPAIIAAAQAIRKQREAPAVTVIVVTADGKLSLAQIAEAHKTQPAAILRATAVADRFYPPDIAHWLDAVFAGITPAAAPVPAGAVLKVPA